MDILVLTEFQKFAISFIGFGIGCVAFGILIGLIVRDYWNNIKDG